MYVTECAPQTRREITREAKQKKIRMIQINQTLIYKMESDNITQHIFCYKGFQTSVLSVFAGKDEII